MNMALGPSNPQKSFVALSLKTNPFAHEFDYHNMPADAPLAEILAAVPNLPDRFWRFGVVHLERGGKTSVVPKNFWALKDKSQALRVRVDAENPVVIRLYLAPSGGGGNGTKSVLAIVATLALLAVGTAITGGALTPLLGSGFALGTFGAQAAALAVTFVGRLAISMVLSPSAQNTNQNQAPVLGSAGASGNTVSPGGSFYYVAGNKKVYPQLVCIPLIEQVDDTEIVEAAYVMAGPHRLRNITAENTPVELIDGLNIVVNQGNEFNPASLLGRYGYQIQPQFELGNFKRDKTTITQLAHQISPNSDIPKPYILTSKNNPDSMLIQLLWPAGFNDPNGLFDCLMPFRLAMKALDGSTAWLNLPEVMFRNKINGRIAKSIEITWDTPPSPIVDSAQVNGAYYAYHTAQEQRFQGLATDGVVTWSAHSSFVGGTQYSNVARVKRSYDRFVIYLDPAVFPRGKRWQVSITRGCIFNLNGPFSTDFNNGSNWYYWVAAERKLQWTGGGGPTVIPTTLYDYRTTSGISYTSMGNGFWTNSMVDTCLVMRFASIWKGSPLPVRGNASIEVRGINVNLTQLACEAAALTPTWDGTGFSGENVSSNPADHFYNVLAGKQTSTPKPLKYIDVPALGAWWADNVARGCEVAGVFDGREHRDVLNAIASAGLASYVEGRLFGVVRQRNTQALGVPAQQGFSNANMIGFRFTKTFAPVPDAIRVSYSNRDLNWDQDQRLVLRPGVAENAATNIIVMDAVAVDKTAQIDNQFKLYQAAAFARDHVFQFETWFDGIASKKGDIISLNHLNISELHQSARIVSVERDGSNYVTAITLDAVQSINDTSGFETVLDLNSLVDLSTKGIAVAASIMTADGVISHPLNVISNATKRVVFTLPFINDNVKPENLVLMGKAGEETLRCEITDISPAPEMHFTVSCVPETPEMWIGIT